MGRIETMEPLGPTATEDDGQRGLKATALIKYFQSYKIEMMTEIRFDQTDYMHGFNSNIQAQHQWQNCSIRHGRLLSLLLSCCHGDQWQQVDMAAAAGR